MMRAPWLTAMICVAALHGVGGCAWPAHAHPTASLEGPVCETGQVRIDRDFEGGGLAECAIRGKGEFDLFIRPEDAPINPSPWYAVRITPLASGPVRVNLRYEGARHRYAPWISDDGDHWVLMDPARISVNADRTVTRIELGELTAPAFLSAQELLTGADYDRWLAAYRERPDLDVSILGHSLEDRPIEMITTNPASSLGSVILVGRQHPPETTGAIAMQAFVDEVLGDSPLASRFRSRFALSIIPQLNPDGVARGHWRHNRGGTDLNRDWGPFGQPETRAARSHIDQLAAERSTRPVLFLDFHSTNRDVFYTQPAGEDGTAYGFTARWLQRASARLPGQTLERAERHQSDLPTAKNYMFGRFGIPSITYEVGDNTDREQIRHSATILAQEMMSVLLENHETPPQ